jgi:hypothetical protein
MNRREWIGGVLGGAAIVLAPSWSRAAPPPEVQARRQANRLELWGSYSRKTKRLVARYTSRRESSLLYEPVVSTGGLAFEVPDRLVLRDDGLTGSTTSIWGDQIAISANESGAGTGPAMDPSNQGGLAWLRDRLVALFGPGDVEALTRECRVGVPKGRTPRLELLPLRDSDARKLVRGVTITFDPVGGAVLIVDISEAQGDRLVLRLSDHRQNPEAEVVRRILEGESRG